MVVSASASLYRSDIREQSGTFSKFMAIKNHNILGAIYEYTLKIGKGRKLKLEYIYHTCISIIALCFMRMSSVFIIKTTSEGMFLLVTPVVANSLAFCVELRIKKKNELVIWFTK